MVLFTLIFVLSGINVAAAERSPVKPVRIVTLMDFKPFIWCEDNVPKGIDIQIVSELFFRVGRAYSIECLPWKRALSYLKSGEADALFSAYKTPERQEFATYLEHPLHYSVFSAFTQKGHEFEFSGTEDLNGKRVGMALGYSVNPEFDAAKSDNKFAVVETTSTSAGLQMLMDKRVDVYINAKEVVLYRAWKMGLDRKVVELPHPLHQPRPAYLMLSKAAHIPEQRKLLKDLSRELDKMWRDGSIDQIIQSFLKPAKAIYDPEL